MLANVANLPAITVPAGLVEATLRKPQVKDFLAASLVNLAFRRDLQGSLLPVEELHIQLLLQVADQLAGRRLGDPTGRRASREALEAGNLAENLERLQVHDPSTSGSRDLAMLVGSSSGGHFP